MKVKINHPMADMVSIIKEGPMGARVYGDDTTSEMAFFMNDVWVIKTIPEFAQYADGVAGDTAVYAYVPDEEIEAFLKEYRA